MASVWPHSHGYAVRAMERTRARRCPRLMHGAGKVGPRGRAEKKAMHGFFVGHSRAQLAFKHVVNAQLRAPRVKSVARES